MIDFKKCELPALFKDYQNKYSALNAELNKLPLAMEYGKGGEAIHRGYYCPSLIYDIVIGNVSRGRLLVRHKNAKYDYIFYKDENNTLRMADKYAEFPERGRVLYEREFLIYQGNKVIAPTFWAANGADEYELNQIAVCEYSPEGKILIYRRLHGYIDKSSGKIPENLYFYAEDYEYDSAGLIYRVTAGDSIGKTDRCDKYLFCHDENGYITSYTVEMPDTEHNNTSGNTYQVPKSKQRII